MGQRAGGSAASAAARTAQRAATNARSCIVAIGRNEGERLERCLRSIARAPAAQGALLVYADSGSSDGSPQRARALGAEVVELPAGTRHTAARGRNAGLARALELRPELELVQFLDGDCELAPDWLERAAQRLHEQPRLGAVCGRRRERRPDASPYNLLCELEWDTPIGPARAFGGDVLARIEAVRAAGGYDPNLIAGEDPDLALRMGRAGWEIERLDAEMSLHDADLSRFGQWWKRERRAGHACAELRARHSHSPERPFAREAASNWAWGAALPLATLAACAFLGPLGLALLALYPLQMLRIALRERARGRDARAARVYACFTVLGKLPQCLGQAQYALTRRSGGSTLIEYKRPAGAR